MFRFAVLLLILPSLLMPPGVCVCQFLQVDRGAPALVVSESAVATRHRDEGTSRANGCCRNCRNQTDRDANSEGQTSASTHSSPEPSHSVPSDRQHAPNCPAAGTVAAAKLTEPPIVMDDFVCVVGDLVITADVAALPRVSATSATPFPITPRYISFRSLLI